MSILTGKIDVAVYIDGFNLYHAIDDLNQPKLKWFSLQSFGKSLLRKGEVLAKVQLFTTEVDWNPSKAIRHRAYVSALKAKGVTVTPGAFKKIDKYCKKYSRECPFREEKQTDVSIGVNIIADAFNNVFQRMILVTADTDQIPSIEMLKVQFPAKEITWVAPPGRMKQAREIGNIVTDRFELTPKSIANCRLPDVVMDSAGQIVCSVPSEYR